MEFNNICLIGVLPGLLACFSGCDDSPRSTAPPINSPRAQAEKKFAPSLDSLSTPDVLRTKYDKVELDCEAMIVKNGDSGNAFLNWDLLKSYSSTYSSTIRARVDGIPLTIDFDIDAVDIFASDHFVDESAHTVYDMKYTPVLTGRYKFDTGKGSMMGAVKSSVTGEGTFSLNERMDQIIINSSTRKTPTASQAANGFEGIAVHFDCFLETIPKPAFREQFVARPLGGGGHSK